MDSKQSPKNQDTILKPIFYGPANAKTPQLLYGKDPPQLQTDPKCLPNSFKTWSQRKWIALLTQQMFKQPSHFSTVKREQAGRIGT